MKELQNMPISNVQSSNNLGPAEIKHEKPISKEIMGLYNCVDIFTDDTIYKADMNMPGNIRIIGKAQNGQKILMGFQVQEDDNPTSNLSNAFGIIQKTIHEGFRLRKGMINFLQAYTQAFIDGKHYNTAKEFLEEK